MPLLRKETEMYPEGFFELPAAQYPWWIAHTLSRREKLLARHLESCGVPFYLPQREHRVRRGERTLVSYLPLLAGYAFFRGAGPERLAALRSNVVARLLEVADQELLARELEQLRSLQDAGATLTVLPDLEPGDPVRITEGPFAGYTGIVRKEKGKQRLLLSITVLRRGISVELGREAVIPVASD